MASRNTRVRIARETVEIIERGWYTTPSGSQVSLDDQLVHARANSRLYTPGDFADVFRRRDELRSRPPRAANTTFRVVNCTTLAAARSLCLKAAPTMCSA
jgi:uncharacterized protein (TIGR02452 family)